MPATAQRREKNKRKKLQKFSLQTKNMQSVAAYPPPYLTSPIRPMGCPVTVHASRLLSPHQMRIDGRHGFLPA